MRTRQTQRKTITLPGQYRSGNGACVDVELSDLSVGGCRFGIGRDPIVPGATVQVFVEGAGPYRAVVKWVENGEAGVTFSVPLTPTQFSAFRHSHVPGHSGRQMSTGASEIQQAPPRRFC